MAKERAAVFSMTTQCVLVLTAIYCNPASAQVATTQAQVLTNAVVNYALEADVSPPLSSIAATPFSGTASVGAMHPPMPTKPRAPVPAADVASALTGTSTIPGPLINATVGLDFEGVGNTSVLNCPSVSGGAVAPPDTNAAVGDTQVVEWVNLCYAVFDKATGALILGPIKGNAFWAGMRSFCATSNAGDIIIQWDKANHVWLASQNVFGPYMTCVAVSRTADATGAYNRYAFPQPGFPDYQKWGLTPNVYYQTQNDFGSGASFLGVNVCAYDAAAMRAGSKKAAQVCILDNSNGTLFDDSMLPADNDYVASGTSTAPEVLLGSIDNPGHNNAVYMYTMKVNFKKGTATLTGVNGSSPIPVTAFNLGCSGFGACIPQPSSGSELLDSLGDRLMYRVAHQTNGSTESWLVTHSVNDTAAVAARWYEFTAPSGSTSLTLHQSGQTPDDGEFRWMGSIAKDKLGNIALGYSRSSAAAGDYPSLYLSGQAAGEALGTTDAESLIFAGSGSQISTGNRWGDYSSMALDGADLCSFWYTNEYYPADGSFAWATRIAGKIKFPGCP
jgi:hypothetical protein